jgi:large subunit ribosomal protein L18
VQLIDDVNGSTLAAASSKDKASLLKKEINQRKANWLVQQSQQKLQKLGLKEVVFDRGGYLYHGRVKAVADGAREGGLKF